MVSSSSVDDPFRISLSTLIETAPLLGHEMDDLRHIRNAQQSCFFEQLVNETATDVSELITDKNFSLGSIDFLKVSQEGTTSFHPLEFNGTGVGGFAHALPHVTHSILNTFSEFSERVSDDEQNIVLVPFSKKSRIFYEKILIAQAIKDGMRRKFKSGRIVPISQLSKCSDLKNPLVVMGHFHEFLEHISLNEYGFQLLHRPIVGCTSDAVTDLLLRKFGEESVPLLYQTANTINALSPDKGLFYDKMNEFLKKNCSSIVNKPIVFSHAFHLEDLVVKVLDSLQKNEKILIKAHASAFGNGIEFFMDAAESETTIREKIKNSIEQAESFYKVQNISFPYTLCQFVDSAVIEQPNHRLKGHKFELRILVFREGCWIKAFPLVVKVSSERYSPDRKSRLMLLNNITQGTPQQQAMQALPLMNQETLEVIGVSLEELASLCRFSTQFVQYALESTHAQPLVKAYV